jgi:membrane-associated protease RseP (regulator of RpoE activity)
MLRHARAIVLSVLSSSVGFTAAYFSVKPRAPTPIAIAPAATPAKSISIALATPCVSTPAMMPSPALVPSLPARPAAPPALPQSAPSAAAQPYVARSNARAPLLGSFRIVGLGPSGGLRLGRVLPQTLAAAIGLRSGDELLSINQFQLGNPEQALTAYARLRSADRLILAVARRGQRTEIVYSIR